MKIISKKCFQFVDGEIVEENGERVRKIRNQIVVHPSYLPQVVPDWIANDELFELAQRDGNLTIFKESA